MLLAARAITFLADVLPSSCSSIVSHGAVPAFCARLLTIEYIDLAEQSLQVRFPFKSPLANHPSAASVLCSSVAATYNSSFRQRCLIAEDARRLLLVMRRSASLATWPFPRARTLTAGTGEAVAGAPAGCAAPGRAGGSAVLPGLLPDGGAEDGRPHCRHHVPQPAAGQSGARVNRCANPHQHPAIPGASLTST